MSKLHQFIHKIPKAELHVHLFGTLLQTRALSVATLNNIPLQPRVGTYKDLPTFITEYDNGVSLFRTSDDFYNITMDYLERCFEQNVKYVELIVDPQSHEPFGVGIETMMDGFLKAKNEAKQFNVRCEFILCFVRHLGLESALQTLEVAKPYISEFIGVGLGGIEQPYPTENFKEVFDKARELGLKISSHCGEGTGSNYIRNALTVNLDRIDHGIDCIHDQFLVQELKEKRIPLTICPISNVCIELFKELKDHPVKQLYDSGLLISLNSDDPSYFNTWLEDVYIKTADTFNLTTDDIYNLAKMSFESSWLTDSEKEQYYQQIDLITESFKNENLVTISNDTHA